MNKLIAALDLVVVVGSLSATVTKVQAGSHQQIIPLGCVPKIVGNGNQPKTEAAFVVNNTQTTIPAARVYTVTTLKAGTPPGQVSQVLGTPLKPQGTFDIGIRSSVPFDSCTAQVLN